MARNSYENEQKWLRSLMDEPMSEKDHYSDVTVDMSDEDLPDPFEDNSEDEYVPEEEGSDFDDKEISQLKRKKKHVRKFSLICYFQKNYLSLLFNRLKKNYTLKSVFWLQNLLLKNTVFRAAVFQKYNAPVPVVQVLHVMIPQMPYLLTVQVPQMSTQLSKL